RGMDQLGQAYDSRPPYILWQTTPPLGSLDSPPDYQKIFEDGPVRLYRRGDLAHVTRSRNLGRVLSWIPGLMLIGSAIFLVSRGREVSQKAVENVQSSSEPIARRAGE